VTEVKHQWRVVVKSLALISCALLFALCFPAEAQQPRKMVRVGYVEIGTYSGSAVLLQEFRQQMTNLGWIEGKNLSIEQRFAEGKPERRAEVAAELVRLNVDVIVAAGTGVIQALKQTTAVIPIVMTTPGDPVGAGLIANLARPGGNITGVSSFAPELTGKRLELLKELIPKLRRVGVLAQPGTNRPGRDLQLKEIRAVSRALEVKLQEIETNLDPNTLENAFQTASREHVDAIITLSGPDFFAVRKPIVELAAKYRLPAIYTERDFADEGGLISYGVDRRDLYRRAALYVDKILKGAKPAELPVEQPKKFELVINLKTAKQIGLTIPPSVLYRADRVIK